LSLTGNLEDLPLLDILQIVSFSKKTGYLGITTQNGEGAIVFNDGFVVASFSWNTPPIDPRIVTLTPDTREAMLRRRIEMALEHLIRLREGQFQFSLADRPPTLIGSRDISLEILDPGINPQELLLDLARGMDEDRRDSSAALEASFAEGAPELEAGEDETLPPGAQPSEPPPAPSYRDPGPEYTALREHLPEYTMPMPALHDTALRTPEPKAAPPAEAPPLTAPPQPPQAETRALLLVDDEEDVRRVLAQHFTNGGYQVVEADDPDAAIKKAQRLSQAGIEFVLVTDLGMPASGGASFHGGFEVVKRLTKMNLKPPVVMMAETFSASVRARAKQMGITEFVFKPGLSKLDPEAHQADLKAFSAKLLADILPKLTPGAAKKTKEGGGPSHTGSARDFRVLQRYLAELRGTPEATRISSLVMSVAREFFERGILFLVREGEEVRGLGGFGPASGGANLTQLVRQIVIPLSEPSGFLEVISTGKPRSGSVPAGKRTDELLDRIGRFRATTAALLPLTAHRDTIAILFGDNPETGREVGGLEALEVFMHQAGIAMENALLQKKLRSMHEKE
jgi:CheY-like chemotaxis protein